MLCLSRLAYVHAHVQYVLHTSSYILSRVKCLFALVFEIETLSETLHVKERLRDLSLMREVVM